MTTTTVTSGQSIGTSTNIGESKFSTKTTLQSTTTAIVVTPQVTNGVADYKGGITIRVWYASSSFSHSTATIGMNALRQTAEFVDLRLSSTASGVSQRDSELTTVTGPDVYIWCEISKLPAAATLSINLTELP